MAIELSTAGVKVGWGIETTTGTKPTAYTRIRGVKSIPSLNPEPETIEVTDLNDTEFKRYVDGLKDMGGALAFTCNLTQQFMDDWDTVMQAYNTGKETGLRLWLQIFIPGLAKGFFMAANPSPLGISEIGVSAALETDAYLTPTFVEGWDTKVTVTEPAALP